MNNDKNLKGHLLALTANIMWGLTGRYSAVTINKWMFIYASMCYIPFSYNDVASIQWATVPSSAILQVLYVVLGGSFVAYICIMSAQKLLRPTVVSIE